MLPAVMPAHAAGGAVVAIDLGGSTLRVAKVLVHQAGVPCTVTDAAQWEVPNSEKTVDRGFFEWMGGCVALWMDRHGVHSANAGVTWSFPVAQTHASAATIVLMGKGYVVDGSVAGADIAQLLQAAVHAHGKRIAVRFITNDLVAVYVAGKHAQGCDVALVLGTGVNACFQNGRHVVNAELLFFGVDLVGQVLGVETDERWGEGWMARWKARPPYLHPASPIFQPLELVAGGRYVCEMVRRVLQRHAATEGSRTPGGGVQEPFGLSGEVVVRSFRGEGVTEAAAQEVRAVVRRAAVAVAAAVVAAADMAGAPPGLVVGYVGTFLHLFDELRGMVEAEVRLAYPGVVLVHVSNSSLVGAAVGAAGGAAAHEKTERSGHGR